MKTGTKPPKTDILKTDGNGQDTVHNEETTYSDITLGKRICVGSQNQNIYFLLLYKTLLKHSYCSNTALQELTI